ncbi:MAG: DegT/DnrJ/EryC1/StrS family aminotransferase [Pirellulales bacterium]|nr:DegT/DnrJ/EryC1/StrS family aminotransferase [Thermoguttaceae bacterium]MDD4786416.1 DegT/DnrJ/EryC1/StrS family aminotransferase [Pirellulales bacterium]MDI9443947.1 DegT/DnrJ/EryC1/StrS family aminotransferase [Planctomycetota bacterium]NLY99074.1 DegT/DnrJ/EryC1/StrS family aminotransferase [Pirellulaceae bacterium]
MSKKNSLSRREFVAGASSLVLAGAAARGGEQAASPATALAIQGGEKAVKASAVSGPRWGDVEKKQLEAMLQQGSLFYWGGPQTKLLTERFQEFCPLEHVQTCSSGTAAIHIAVAAAGIGLGDEVITSPVTDIGTVIGVLYQQAVPVFADLGAGTYNLDVADVERRITPKTKAIIAVHLTGNPCDLNALKALADRHNLVLIEDCAQAWGARYRGKPIGTVGHLACFSLQNSKHITCGDGGVVASSDERFGPLLQKYGDKGGNRSKWGGFDAFATNYRMSEPQAAVVAAQLTRLEEIAAKRARLGNLLTEKIADLPGIIPHQVHPEDRAVYWFYMFRMQPEGFRCGRSEFVRALTAEGAPVRGGYIGVPLYGEPVFQKHAFFAGRWPVKEMGLTTMDFSKHKCPEAEAILVTGMRVPVNEFWTEEYVLQVAAAIRKVARHYAV